MADVVNINRLKAVQDDWFGFLIEPLDSFCLIFANGLGLDTSKVFSLVRKEDSIDVVWHEGLKKPQYAKLKKILDEWDFPVKKDKEYRNRIKQNLLDYNLTTRKDNLSADDFVKKLELYFKDLSSCKYICVEYATRRRQVFYPTLYEVLGLVKIMDNCMRQLRAEIDGRL